MSAKDVAPIFKLADLLQLYTDRLIELAVDITGHIHSTDFKNRILANVPGLNYYKEGQEATMMLDMRCVMRAWTMLMMRPFGWPRQQT